MSGIQIAPERMKAIEASDYGLNGDIGGLHYTTYWTPDGRKIKAIPNMREFVTKDSTGKVTGSGTRDANFDKGWLAHPPAESEKKLFCQACDGWHDTKEQVTACKTSAQKTLAKYETLARKDIAKEVDQKDLKISELERKIEVLAKLVEAKLG